MADYTSRTVTKATSRLRDVIFQLLENDDENNQIFDQITKLPKLLNYYKLRLHMELSELQHFNSTYRIIFPLFHRTIFVVHFPTTLETRSSCDLRVSSPPVDHRQAEE